MGRALRFELVGSAKEPAPPRRHAESGRMPLATDSRSSPTGKASEILRQNQRSPAAVRDAILARSTGVHYLFDNLTFIDSVKPPDTLMSFLKTHAASADAVPDKLKFHYRIIIVAANQ